MIWFSYWTSVFFILNSNWGSLDKMCSFLFMSILDKWVKRVYLVLINRTFPRSRTRGFFIKHEKSTSVLTTECNFKVRAHDSHHHHLDSEKSKQTISSLNDQRFLKEKPKISTNSTNSLRFLRRNVFSSKNWITFCLFCVLLLSLKGPFTNGCCNFILLCLCLRLCLSVWVFLPFPFGCAVSVYVQLLPVLLLLFTSIHSFRSCLHNFFLLK